MDKSVDYASFFKDADRNGDGMISTEEWAALGIADRAYTLYAGSDKDGLTVAEMNATGAFPGLDSNNDKQITLKEFQDFDRSRRNAGPGGPPPGEMPKPN
jgi:hypothetical protein